MTARQQRRAAERAQRKLEQKQAKQIVPGEAKIAANQANALHSTGPRTAEGKTISSQNSFKHGLYSKKLVIEGEDPAELDALRADLFAEHQPQTETETLLVTEMADQYWRLRRARRMEVAFLTEGAVVAHLNAAQRMMTTAERGFYKALKSLRELQKQRGSVPQKPAIAAASEAAAVGFVPQKSPNRPAPEDGSAPQIGFDPQNDPELRQIDEELAAIERFLHAAQPLHGD